MTQINQSRLLKNFLSLVRIDSESGSEQAMREVVRKQLEALGLKTRVDRIGNLHATLTGEKQRPVLLLSAHLDTVKPGIGVKPIVKNGWVTSNGKTVLGGDDKSGITEIIEMLTLLRETKQSHGTIKLLLTVQEEIGLKGSAGLTAADLKADFGIVLDCGGPIGTVVTSAPAQNTLTAWVTGRAAHAGMEPEKGINAIVAAAKAIAALPLGRIDDETTANIGIITGGRATNIVPDHVEVRGEARSRNEKTLERQTETMKKLFTTVCKQSGASVRLDVQREYDAFCLPEKSPLVTLCQGACKHAKLPFRIAASGGGSDANHFNRLGLPTVVLSTGMDRVHTTKERIRVEDLVKATSLLLAIIEQCR